MNNFKKRLVAYSVSVPIIISLIIIIINRATIPGFHFFPESRTAVSEVKANMHIFQNMVETYAQKHSGVYPENDKKLYAHAKKNGYWQDFKNPYSSKENDVITIWKNSDRDSQYLKSQTGEQLSKRLTIPQIKGHLLYIPEDSKNVTKYYIYGIEDGSLIRDRGRHFFVSNSQ